MKKILLGLCFLAYHTVFAQSFNASYPLNGNAQDFGINHYNGAVEGALPAADRNGNTDEAYFAGDLDEIIFYNKALNNCSDVVDSSYVVASFTAPLNNNRVSSMVYPNPTQGVFHVNALAGKKVEMLQMLNAEGKICVESSSNEIDVSAFPMGMYFVKIYFDDNSFSTEKLIVK